MNQDSFERRHAADWARFEAWLSQSRRDSAGRAAPAAEIPHLYRRLCHHLALARSRRYGPALVERLHNLVLQGHQQLYSARAGGWSRVAYFLGAGFPALVRAEWRLFWIATALFYGPALFMFVGALIAPDLVLTVLDQDQLADIELMYHPGADVLGRARGSDTDVAMFGYYIRNNIGIAFQTFAGGILYGLGTLFFLIFNGVFLGAVFGHLTRLGYIETFYGFVAGHSALELTAIVLAGVAGLKLGLALLKPGRRTRPQALKAAAAVAVRIVYGAGIMLLAAALVEAFWSSGRVFPVEVKYAVGIAGWLLVAAYFLFAGRRHAP